MTELKHTLFNGPFYIDGQYALSLIPGLISVFNTDKPVASSEYLDKKKELSVNLQESSSVSDTRQVVVVSIKQPILKYSDYWYGLIGSKDFMSILNAYKNNDSIAGVVLDIDSGGGQVYGTPEFYDYLKSYPKPIVAYTDGYMCSAAYYIGSATSYIVANKRADHIGSIGAYASFVDSRGFLEKFGAKVHTIYATKSTEKNKEYREILDNSNYEPYIKNQLDPIVDTFHEDMKSSRPNLDASVFAGGTWNGPEALNKNLIDELGTLETAVSKVFELSQANNKPTNTSTMSKERKQLQAVLDLEGPLAATEDNGSYLNEEQLDAVEQKLVDSDAAVLAATTAQETAEDNLKQAQAAATTIDEQVKALATLANAEPGATTADTLAAISAQVTELNKKPGDVHTTVTKTTKEDKQHSYMDFETPFYQKAKQLLN